MIETKITSTDLAKLVVAIKREDDGKLMLRDLRTNLRTAIKPGVTSAKAAIMSMPSTGLRNVGGSMRSAIRKEIKPETKLTQRSAVVKIRVRRQGIRGLKDPAKRFNSNKPWRHPVRPWKREGDQVVALPRNEWTWVTQVSPKPRWFDDAVKGHHAEYETAVRKAMNDAAERIAHTT